MSLNHHEIIFTRNEAERLAAEMDQIIAQHADVVVSAARSWVNLRPYFGEQFDEHIKQDPLMRRMFSARGHQVPHATWLPPYTKKRRSELATLGLIHPQGPKAIARLAAGGIVTPEDWIVKQDHSRRGIVLALPASVSSLQALTYLLDASEELCDLKLPGRWMADIVGV